MKKAKCDFYSTKLSHDLNPKEMWKTLNEVLPKNNNTALGASTELSATKFNKFFTTIAENLCRVYKKISSPPKVLTPREEEFSSSFVCQDLSKIKSTKATGLDSIPAKLLKDAAPIIAKPIAHLINRTILTGKIPSQWKEAKVIPIFKAGQRSDEYNYRPISVLPVASKIMERAVQVQLLKFLTDLNILSIYQSGFRKKHSTETAVVYLADYILEEMDKQKLTGAAFIDLKKAFDLVNHR